MSFLDDLSNFGSGALDSLGEGFDNLVDKVTSDDSSVNANTQPQATYQADSNGNKITPTDNNKPLLYVGGGLGMLLLVGIVVLAVKK